VEKFRRLNLTSTLEFMEPLHVGQTNKLAVDVILGSGFSWGSAVVALQWSIKVGKDDDGNVWEQWNAFSPARTLSSTTTNLVNVPVGGLSFIRLVATTADGASDPNAIAVFRLV
jgi:hypothetical protein